jgi:hypothetical protein
MRYITPVPRLHRGALSAERAQIVNCALTEEPATIPELSRKTGLSVQALGCTILPLTFRQGRVRLCFRTQRGQPQPLYSKPETHASQGLLEERGMEEHALIAPG